MTPVGETGEWGREEGVAEWAGGRRGPRLNWYESQGGVRKRTGQVGFPWERQARLYQ